MVTLRLRVRGMSCQHCVRAVEEAVHSVLPDARVQVDLEGGLVVIEAPQEPDRERLARAIEEAGYEVAGNA